MALNVSGCLQGPCPWAVPETLTSCSGVRNRLRAVPPRLLDPVGSEPLLRDWSTAKRVQFSRRRAATLKRARFRAGADREGAGGVKTMAAPGVRQLSGLEEIAPGGKVAGYEAWLLDQFGVLHDGKKPYPGAIATLERLAASGAKLILLSNSSKRAAVTAAKLIPLGFDPELFAGVVTSGELTHQNLLCRTDPWFASLGRKCVHVTWSDRGAVSIQGLGLEVVDSVEDADFILAHGTEALGVAGPRDLGEGEPDPPARPVPLQVLEEVVGRGAVRGLPLVVANPDEVTVEARALRVMPGTLGKQYEALGGEVKWMGKPAEVVYQTCASILGVAPSGMVAVGDSLRHDVAGAAANGIDSVFVCGGIHADDLGIRELGDPPNPSRLEQLLSSHGQLRPTYHIPMFRW